MLEIESFGSLEALLGDETARARMTEAVRARRVCVIRRVIEPAFLERVVAYLADVGRGSLPARVPTAPACPNHHRAYRGDERSYVKGVYHQFSFFPWNEDVFDLFARFHDVYRLRNLLNGLPERAFLGHAPERGCIARLSFQYYPRGVGGMNRHADPVDVHQLVVPLMTLSRFGRDYESGGLFFENPDGARLYIDPFLEPGDMVFSLAEIPHGVDTIDPSASEDWLSFRGRWSTVFAVNRMADAPVVADPVDLDRDKPRKSG